MDKFVARLNIDHFRKMLATERDDSKRETLLSLLAEEEAKLAACRDEGEVRSAEQEVGRYVVQ
jgi:hypothetical protein